MSDFVDVFNTDQDNEQDTGEAVDAVTGELTGSAPIDAAADPAATEDAASHLYYPNPIAFFAALSLRRTSATSATAPSLSGARNGTSTRRR